MTLFTRLRSLVKARLGHALQRLRSALAGGMPRPAPLLVPVPVRTDRRAPFAARRLPGLRGPQR